MSKRAREFGGTLGSAIIKPLRNNFVERPWGGSRIREFKGLCPLPDQHRVTGAGLGECFEIAAFDDDAEARAHPSRIVLADGTIASLPALLHSHATTWLGERWVRAHGPQVPLLPKILDIRELLSVQGHPHGSTEVYVIIDADPGATIRLGWHADMDRERLHGELSAGRAAQLELTELLRADADQSELQAMLARWFAERTATVGDLLPDIERLLDGQQRRAAGLLVKLKSSFWHVLDAMNEIPVAAGQVIHNVNPPRITALSGRPPTAEVHALGNPNALEIVALEIRRPGPTLRAWDHVRFPLRKIDVDAALDVLNLRATAASEFIVEPRAVPGRPYTSVSIDSTDFRLEHLRPPAGEAAPVELRHTHCLHNLGSAVALETHAARELGVLERGESALVPERVGPYRLRARGREAHVVKVSLP